MMDGRSHSILGDIVVESKFFFSSQNVVECSRGSSNTRNYVEEYSNRVKLFISSNTRIESYVSRNPRIEDNVERARPSPKVNKNN